MPNDLTAKRNLFNRRADAPTSQRQKLVSSGFTASIWTISGVVLAACSSTIEDIEEFLGLDDDGDGGGNALHVQRSPVQGARIYFDMDNDGVIDTDDITAQDEAFPQGFVTDSAGRAHNIPAVFHGLPFKAVLDGAIDADTGAPLSGEMLSIPGADGTHRLASPITDLLVDADKTPEEVVAELLPNANSAEIAQILKAINNPRNYLGDDDGVEGFAFFLAKEQEEGRDPAPTDSKVQAQAALLLADDPTDSNRDTLIVVNADGDDSTTDITVTIGTHDSYVATIQAVSHAGGVGYRFVDANRAPTTISDFSINAQGVISFIGENPTTTTLHIEVSNGTPSETQIVRVAVTVADAPSLDELPAGDETATIMENVAGAAGDGTALITGITTSATNPSWEISEANPAGQSAIADKFGIVSGTGDTFNLVLKAGEILNYDAIPGGVLNLHVWAEVGVDKVRSNALALRIHVEEDPDEVAFSGSFTGIVAEDGNLIAQGTFSVENQGSATATPTDGTYGTLTLADGRWTYTLDDSIARVDELLTGQTLIDTATISVGGASQNIVIRINGENEDVRFVDGDGNRITSGVSDEGIEIGADATGGVNLGDVVPEIRGLLASNDDSNVVLADDMGGLFSLDSATGILTFTGTAAQIAGLNGSANLVLVLTAPASIGDAEVTLDLSVNVINAVDDGDSDYEIIGDIIAGETLEVRRISEDPDGEGAVSIVWYRGDASTPTGDRGTTYRVTAADDEGETIGAVITYRDGANTPESIDITASSVAFASGMGSRPINVDEGTIATTTTLATVSATSKLGEAVSYAIGTAGDHDNNLFDVNSNGEISLLSAGTWDYESNKREYIVEVIASAADGEGGTDTARARITFAVQDVNEHAPAFVAADGTNGLEYAPTIPENTRVGAEIARVRATDADGTAPNNAVRYSITSGNVELLDNNGDPTGAMLFSMGGDGAITLNGPLDFDTAPTSYTLTITASDGGANPPADAMTATATVTITLTDVNDVAPTIAASTDTGAVEDGDADGTDTGIRVVISDDAVDEYQFTYIHTVGFADISGFELRQVSGTTYGLYTSESFDFDGFDETIKNIGVLAMTIGVRDTLADGSTTPESIIPVRITITDINDNAPSLTVAGTGTIAEIGDNAPATHPAIDVAGITLTTADADTGTHAVVEAGYFSTDDARFAVVAGDNAHDWTLQLKANAALDFEADNSIMLTITLDDGTNPATTRDVTINIGNEDDGMADYLVTQSGTELTVALVDDNPNSATYSGDPDGVAGGVSYRWFTTNNNGATQTAITGITDTTSALLDISGHTLTDGHIYGVAISYTDNANMAYTGDNAIIVLNSGVRFGESNYAISITDGAAPASVMIPDTSAMLTPPKTGVTITYDFDTDGNPGDYFSINPNTGALTLKAAVDYDTATDKSFTLTLKATPSDTDIKPTTATVTVTLVDENDNKPSLSAVSGNTATIIENAVDANVGISFTITDADAPATNGFTANSFDIAAGAGTNAATAAKFTMVQNGDDWDLRLKPGMSLDYETDGTSGTIKLAITVNDGQASDAGLSDAETITITVTDLNDNPPTSSGESGTATLIEAAAANTNTDTGYSFTLADDDTDAVNRHEFMILGNESSRFAFVKDGTTANQWNLVLLAGQTVDREMDGASIMLNFQVNDESNRPLTALSTTVAITDANEANPTVAITSIATTQGEQTVAAGGVNVASFAVTDADATAYARANVELSGDSRFEITGWDATAKTGMIRLKAGAVLDYETAADRSITLTITATDPLDNSVTDTDTVTITVTDENDNAPTATTSGTASLTEADAVSTNTDTGFSITLADDDTDTVNQHAITIDDTTLATRFGFVKDGTTANQWNLVLLANQIVDREGDGETLTIAYTISDDTNTPITDSVDVSIIDANDEPTVIGATKVLWESPTVSGTIPENSYTAGTEIASAIVNDADVSSNLEYRLTKGGSTFSIGSTDGIITFTADTDVDADSDPTSYTLAYEVRDRDGAWESSGDITLTITGIDDEKPELGTLTWRAGTGTQGETTRTIDENQGSAPILTMSVSDPDTATASLTPTIQGGSPVDASNNPIFSFGILNNQAILSVLSSRLDHETAPNTYTLTLVVTDGTRTDTETVTINVGDINDNVPDIVVADSTPSVTARTASADTDIISGITVTDADTGKTYAQGDFELTGDSKFKFVWDATAQTGSVVLKSGETIAAGTISLSLTVTDANPVGHSGTDTETLTITVTELVNGGTTGTAMQYDPSAADASGTLTYIDAALVKANPVAGDYTATGATYGTATVDESGAWTYNVDNTHAMVKGLASGATLTDTFTISVPLAAGGTGDVDVTVTITGVTVVEGTANADTGAASGNPVNRAAATAFEVIHGSDHNDVITVGAEGAVVFGGYGDDTINLRNGKTDIVVYRFSSIDGGSWRADDGGDIINNFERDRDIFILVDDDVTPIDDLDTLLSRDTTPFVPDTIVALNDKPKFTGPLVDNMFGQFQINFLAIYDVDGPGPLTTPPTGENVFINFVNKVSRAGAVTQGLVNDDTGDGWDLGNNEVTDFSNVPNWLTTDIDAHVGLVVMSIDQLAIDVL